MTTKETEFDLEQQRRRDLFEQVAIKLLPESDIPSDYKDIMQKAKGFTEKLIRAAETFATKEKS